MKPLVEVEFTNTAMLRINNDITNIPVFGGGVAEPADVRQNKTVMNYPKS